MIATGCNSYRAPLLHVLEHQWHLHDIHVRALVGNRALCDASRAGLLTGTSSRGHGLVKTLSWPEFMGLMAPGASFCNSITCLATRH